MGVPLLPGVAAGVGVELVGEMALGEQGIETADRGFKELVAGREEEVGGVGGVECAGKEEGVGGAASGASGGSEDGSIGPGL